MNGNPFYVPPAIPDLSGTMMDLYKIKLSQDELGMRGKTLEETIRSNRESEAMRGREIAATEARTAMEGRKMPVHRQNYSAGDNAMLRLKFKPFGVDNSVFVEESSKLAVNPQVDRLGAYEYFKERWPEYQADMIEKAQDSLNRAVEKNPGYLNSLQGKRHVEFIEGLTRDAGGSMLDLMFKQTLQGKQMEEENTRSALQAARLEAQKPIVVPEGASLVSPSGGVLVEGSPKKMDPFTTFYNQAKESGKSALEAADFAAGRVAQMQKEGKISVGVNLDKVLMQQQGMTLRAELAEIGREIRSLSPLADDYEQRKAALEGERDEIKKALGESGMGVKPKKTPSVDAKGERDKANAAIKAGKDPAQVKALFKQRTGQDL